MNKFASVTGGTTGRSTWMPAGVLLAGHPNGGNQVAGYKPLMWLMALLMAALVAGCGGQDPILGGGGAGVVPHVTGDTTRPRVAVTVPANAASGVPANTQITATFSEAMLAATLNNTTTFTVARSGVPVTGGPVSYSTVNKIASFKPSSDLTPGDLYTATITTAATDLAGNALAGNQAPLPAASNYVWSFIAVAADLIRPIITLESPANLATLVPINSTVNATFSKAMDPATLNNTTFTVEQSGVPGTILGAYTYDSLTDIDTFTPTGNLSPSTTYIATITAAATDLAGNALDPFGVGTKPDPWSFTTDTGTGLAPGAVDLGSASTFGLMATAAVTAASASIINGDVSLEPGTSITGFPPAVINGAVHVNDTVSHQARNDLLASYNYAKGLACTTTVSAALGSMYVYPTGIPPGVYCSGSTMLVDVGAPIVLDGGGNANAVWVFQIGSSMTSNANVTLRGGAQAKNVFWVPTSDMTIGSGTTFNGTIVAGRDTTSAGFATINGRILTGAITAGTIALNGTPSTVNVPAP